MRRLFVTYKGLPPSIYILFIATIINRAGNFVIPFLAIYSTKNLGLSEEMAGFFVMLASLAGMPGLIVGGILADRVGRKKTLAVFLFASACCILSCAFIKNTQIILGLLILSTFFTEGAQPGNSAMVTDLTGPDNRNEAFSLIYLGINIGFSIGSLTAGFLYNNYIKWFFVGDAVSTFIAVLLIVLFTKETIPQNTKIDLDRTNLSKKESLLPALKERPYIIMFIAGYIIYSFIYIQGNFAEPLYINAVFGKEGPRIFGSVMAINALSVVLLGTFITSAVKKINSVLNVALGGLFYAIGFGMLFFTKSYGLLIISTIFWTIGEMLATVNASVYIANHSPEACRGRFISMLPFIERFGFAIGTVGIGIYINAFGITTAWVLIFFLALMAVTFMYGLHLYEKRRLLPQKVIETKLNQ